MEITKEMLIEEFKRQIDFANFIESQHTTPFRKEFLEFAIQYILDFEDENNRLRKSYQIAVQDNAETCRLLFKAEDEVKEIRAKTVREMQKRLIEYYSSSIYRPTQKHPTKHTMIEHLFYVIDQIAEEMIGETR